MGYTASTHSITLRIALRSLEHHKIRSFLTMVASCSALPRWWHR